MYEGKILFISPKGYGMILTKDGNSVNERKIFAPKRLMVNLMVDQKVMFDCEPGNVNKIATRIAAYVPITQPS